MPLPPIEEFVDISAQPAVRGFLHLPAEANGDSLLLTHGAGANCQSKLLWGLSTEFAQAGYTVLRFDLPFRQARRFGPPSPSVAEQDRAGIARAIKIFKPRTSGRLFAGGHSYGGRQTTMLLAEQPHLVSGLLLLSYPLHPPRKPEQLRTAHFPKLICSALFVHGSRDPFASQEEMSSAVSLLPARHALMAIEGAGHDLIGKSGGSSEVLARIAAAFQEFIIDGLR